MSDVVPTRATSPAGPGSAAPVEVALTLRLIADHIECGAVDVTVSPDERLLLDVTVGEVRCVLQVCRPDRREALSPREEQVARMVADGRTNRAIATALDISLWTVSTHLRRIFAKTGVVSRAEMVAHLFGGPGRGPLS